MSHLRTYCHFNLTNMNKKHFSKAVAISCASVFAYGAGKTFYNIFFTQNNEISDLTKYKYYRFNGYWVPYPMNL